MKKQKQSKAAPIASISRTGLPKWDKIIIHRYQGKKFEFCVRRNGKRHKICQVIFHSDGSLFVIIPYFDKSNGIVCVGTLPLLSNTTKINLVHRKLSCFEFFVGSLDSHVM